MLAGQDLGGGHQGRLGAGSRHIPHGQHGHHGLAGAHIPLEQAAHPLTRREVAADLGQAAGLGAGQLEGQVRLNAVRQGGWQDSGGWLLAPLSLALGHGQLVGQQFVIGQPADVVGVGQQVGLGLWRMQPRQRLAPRDELLPSEECGVLPLGKFRSALKGFQHKLADRARRQAGGGGIDRLHLWDVGGAVGGDDVVRMGDLQGQAEPFDLAGDQPLGAHRVLGLQLAAEAAEEHQIQRSGPVIGFHLPRLLGTARFVVGVDLHQEGLDLTLHGVDHGGIAPADQGMGLQERHVADNGPGQFLEQRRHALAHPLQGGDGGIERE